MSFGGAVFAAIDNSVSVEEAYIAALNCIEKNNSKFNCSDNATVGQPVIYYAPDNTKSAYEFTVLDDGKESGFIIVSARKGWMPVLEYGGGKAPSSFLNFAEETAVGKGYLNKVGDSKPKFFYWGALSYSVQLGENMKTNGKVIHLTTGVEGNLPKKNNTFQMNSSATRGSWDIVLGEYSESIFETVIRIFEGTQVNAATTNPLVNSSDTVLSTTVKISGFPDFYQDESGWPWDHGDDNGESASWPSCVGTADDPWAHWDGCAAIAGANVIAYWHDNGYPSIPDPDSGGVEDTLIDYCHYYMGTNYYGSTSTNNIDDGIEYVANTIYGYDFDVVQSSTSTISTAWGWIVDEIDDGRPFVLSMTHYPEYGANHAVAAFGYEDNADINDDWVICKSGWNYPDHYILRGAWSCTYIDKVFPSE